MLDIIRQKVNNFFIQLKRITTIILIIILFGFVVFRIYNIYFYNESYQMYFESSRLSKFNEILYIKESIDSNKFGQFVIKDDEAFAEILGSPISIAFQPEFFPLNKNIKVSLVLNKDKIGDWEISLLCPNCDEKYDWKPFYYGFLLDYKKIFNQNNINIFARDTDLEYRDERISIADFIKDNIPLYSTVKFDLDFKNDRSIDFKKSDFKNTDAISEFISNSITIIEADLRGPHTFYVVLGDSMDLTIKKSDLNWEDGEDSMCIYLYNLDDELIYENMISGDGIDIRDISESRKNIIKENFQIILSDTNIYKLSFQNCDNSKKMDWVIDSLEINTNKIVSSDSLLTLEPTIFYTEIKNTKDIQLNIWWQTALQIVNIVGIENNIIVNLDESTRNQDVFVNLKPDKYNIDTKGAQIISGANFAFSKNNFFFPYTYDFENLGHSDFFITKYDYNILDDDWVKVSHIFNARNIRKLQDLKEIVFVFRNNILNEYRSFINNLHREGFVERKKIGKYIIYGKNNLLYTDIQTRLSALLSHILPKNARLYLDSEIPNIDQYSFINKSKPMGFSKSMYELDNIALRGEHSFYIYLEDYFYLQIEKEDLNWYEGRDDVNINLYDINTNKLICTLFLLDDNNLSSDGKRGKVDGDLFCRNLESGPYMLKIEADRSAPRNNDFIITNMRLNTNKIMVKDRILNKKAIDLYVNSRYENNTISFNHWRDDSHQNISINKNILEFTEDNLNQWQDYILEKGINKISLEKGHITIQGENFLFEPENYFAVYDIYVVEDYKTADFVILENTYPHTIYFKEIILDIFN